MRWWLLAIVLGVASLSGATSARAGGGTYVFSGGTPAEQATVAAALEASSFDWGRLPRSVTVHIGSYTSSADAGDVYLDAQLLDAGKFSWGVVQHEFAHQIDFMLLDDADRATLTQHLGGAAWCTPSPERGHGDLTCERFASEVAWAYWPSPENCMRPTAKSDEAAAMPPAAFRALLGSLLGWASPPAASVAPTKTAAFVPTVVLGVAVGEPRRKTKRTR